MKKRITFLTLVSAMLSMNSFVSAQEPVPYDDYETVEVYTTNEWIEIDGIDDEAIWANTAEQTVAKTLHDWGVDPVPNTWGFAATYKVTRDENYLYFFVKVKDATYVPYDAALMSGDTNVDNIEFLFFPNPDDKDLVYGSTDARPRGHSQLRASVGSTDNRATGGGYAMGFANKNQIVGYEYKTVKTADGYNMEVVIPLDVVVSDAYVGNLEVGKKILFDINIANCTDYASNRVIILGWSGDDYHGWRWNAKLGDMVFKGEGGNSISSSELSEISYTFENGLLSLTNADNAQVDIYDITGRFVKSTIYSGSAIDLSAVASGMYIVNVANISSFKIMK